jgi:hypothetical protein
MLYLRIFKLSVLLLLLHGTVFASDKFKLPHFAATFDFDPSSFDNRMYGFRVYALSNQKFWSNGTDDGNFPITYGLGVGSYRGVNEIGQERDDRFLSHAHLVLLFTFKNKTLFEPFAGVYPGIAWDAQQGFFFNPVIGSNFFLFDVDRNWNSKIFRLDFQLRGEYNTLLSSVFVGGGFIFSFFQ